jgi:hypothetical protein
LRCHTRIFQADIGRHEAHFVDADPSGIGNGGLELLSKFRRLRLPSGKCMYELCQLLFTHLGGELHARQPRSRQELCELFLCRRAFQWHAIQKQLRSGCPQQQSLVGILRNGGTQFVPGNTQLPGGASMVVPVKPREL